MSDIDQSAIEELLSEARRLGVGVAFEPDGDGWSLSYILPHSRYDWPGGVDYQLAAGPLTEAYELDIACRAALMPLRRIARDASRFRIDA